MSRSCSSRRLAVAFPTRFLFAGGIVAVLAFGAFLRVQYGAAYMESARFWAPQNDPQAYLAQARQLCTGSNPAAAAPYFKAPFYPYWLAALSVIGLNPLVWARWLQWGLGLLSALLGGAITRELGGQRSTALVAIALLGWTGSFIYFEGEVLFTAWIVCFDLAAMLVLLRGQRLNSGWRYALSGLLWGLSAITRPTVLPFLALAVLLILWGETSRRGFRTGVVRTSLFVLALALPILPVTVRNYYVGHDLVLISSQGGIAFYTGNNPDSDGAFGSPAGFKIIGGNWEYYDCVRMAEQARGRTLRPSEVSRFFVEKGLHYWQEQPLAALRLWGRKALLFMGRPRIANNQDLDVVITENVAGHWWAGLFSPGWDALLWSLGLGGGLLLQRDRRWPLLFIVIYSLTVVSYFVATRYRMPVLACAIPLAPLFLVDPGPRNGFVRAAHSPQLGRLPALGVSLAILLLTWNDWFGLDVHAPTQAEFARAVSLLELQRDAQAKAALQKVLAEDPSYPRAWLNLGVIARRAGQADEAEAAFRKELSLHPDDPLAANNLGALFLEAERPKEALPWFQRAQKLQPNYVRAIRNEALAYAKLGATGPALEALDRALAICEVAVEYQPDLVGVLTDRGAVLAQQGRLQAAAQEYRRALAINPERREARLGLGSVLGRAGELQAAGRELAAVLDADPGCFEALVDLGNVRAAQGHTMEARHCYEKALLLSPQRPEPLFGLAALALREGDDHLAREQLEACLRLRNDFQPARQALAALESHQSTPSKAVDSSSDGPE